MKKNKQWLFSIIVLSILVNGYSFLDVYANNGRIDDSLSNPHELFNDLTNDKNYLVVVLKNTIESESSNHPLLDGMEKKSLSYYLDIFNRIANDAQIHGLLLKIQNPTMTMTQRQELIESLQKIRENGKRMIAFSHSFLNQNDYLIATVADQIYTTPLGGLSLKGISIEIPFFKRILDWIGVKGNFLYKGNYKTSNEVFTRQEASSYLTESMNGILDGLYDEYVQLIAKNRKKPISVVLDWFNKSLFTSESAKKLNLIDGIYYEDQLEKELNQTVNLLTLEEESFKIKNWFSVEKIKDIFSAFLSSDESQKIQIELNHIAVVHMRGTIVENRTRSSLFHEGDEIDLASYLPLLEELANNDTVKGVVLRINSRGGSALVSDLLSHAIRKLAQKKPVVASLGDMAASGGYYLAMSAPFIFTNPYTVTGSIGVISGKMSFRKLYNKLGVDKTIFKRGNFANLDSDYSDYTAAEVRLIEQHMEDVYQVFIEKVSNYRKISLNKVKEYAQGKVYTGRQALDIGLVDAVGGFTDAIAKVKELYLKKEKRVDKLEIIHYPKSPVFENLFKSLLVNAQGKMLVSLLSGNSNLSIDNWFKDSLNRFRKKLVLKNNVSNVLQNSCSSGMNTPLDAIPDWFSLFKNESAIVMMPYSLCFN